MRHIIVSGATGSGKSTVAAALARRHDLVLIEADDLHPAQNVAKMRAGRPLDDDDRMPWLERVRAELDGLADTGDTAVVACSALKRAYRDLLAGPASDVFFVQLVGEGAVLTERVARRETHFMPPSLVGSQLAALEPLADVEAGVAVAIADDRAAVLTRVEAALRRSHMIASRRRG